MRVENARMRQRIIDLERVISNVMLRLSPDERQEAEADRGANTTQH
jgi:hypothetical protein